MDYDLVAALLGVLGTAVIASVLGYRLGHSLRPSLRVILFCASLLVTSIYASILVGRLEWARYITGSDAVFLTNATPVLIFFAIGVGSTVPNQTESTQKLRFAAMAFLSLTFFVAPWLRSQIRPVVSDEQSRFAHGICLQSHPATCAPAAAATLLVHHGVIATERQLIERCLTSSEGTEPLGLYRGLSISTKRTRLNPRLASKDPNLWKPFQQFPLIALVSFHEEVSKDTPTIQRILGRQGDGHAIVVFGQKANGDFVVGDPAVGRMSWDSETFARRFCGDAIFLLKRR